MGEEFQRVALLPIGVGEREEIAALGCAGIVHEDVEMAEFAPRGRDQCGRGGGIAQVERAHRGLAALAADRRRDIVERRCVAAGQQQVAAFVGKRQSDAAADAAARSGHQRDLPLQPELHASLLMRASADGRAASRPYRICRGEKGAPRVRERGDDPSARAPLVSKWPGNR
jgi:hypothetical protein